MNKDEALKLAIDNRAKVSEMSYDAAWTILCLSKESILAFANACEKIGMEKAHEANAEAGAVANRDMRLEAELLGKKLGRKYALMEAGNIARSQGERTLAKIFYAMAAEIVEI